MLIAASSEEDGRNYQKAALMKNTLLVVTTVGISLALAAPLANAQTLFYNAPNLSGSQTGDCVYNTTCGSINTGNTFAAQQFTLSSASTITALGFNAIVFGDVGASANYMLFTPSQFNTPGSVVAAGSSLLTATSGPTGVYYPTTEYKFYISPLSLKAGDYFFAFQNMTPDFYDYLSKGTSASGAFQSNDGGLTFSSSYRNFPSVAVSVYGDSAVSAVPEPSTWAMMLLGFGGLGVFAYRRTRNSEANAAMLAA